MKVAYQNVAHLFHADSDKYMTCIEQYSNNNCLTQMLRVEKEIHEYYCLST